MIALVLAMFVQSLVAVAITEPVILAVIGLITAALTLIFSSIVTPIVLFILKEKSDKAARKLAKEEAEEARKVIKEKIDENTALTKIVEEKADKSYKEANNLNLKIESAGIQTKPALGESAENPVHTITP